MREPIKEAKKQSGGLSISEYLPLPRPRVKSKTGVLIGRPPAVDGYAAMSGDQLLDECRALYEREGITAFSFKSLKFHKLYFPLYSKGLKLAHVIKALHLEDEYHAHRLAQPMRAGGRECFRWTWDRVLTEAREVAEEQGSLPAAAWFQANGHGSLVSSVYSLGFTWVDLRSALKDFSNSNFVESRNGLRWLSHAEASLSNFLYARGIEHRKGRKYADGYAEHSGYRYGMYDLRFLASDGRWVDVEVWGDKPLGLEEEYRAKRILKEDFNQENNPNFLGVGFRDCYEEKRLTDVLEPHIGRIEPFQFDKPTDRLIHATHWSNADELLEYARHLTATMPDGKFPTEEWLRKRGKWVDRPGEALNTFSVYIKLWFGGVRNLRKLLDQEQVSTIDWTAEKALEAYREFTERHGMTPDQARQRYKRKGELSAGIEREASKIAMAVLKYAGGAVAARESLGIDLVRGKKWTRDLVVTAAREIVAEYGLSPIQLLSDHRAGHVILPETVKKRVGQVIGASGHWGGMPAILKEIGFTPPSRYWTRRKTRTKL
ncbi:hypothetical protein [Tunturiibacter gelidiferens]|uniref:hypothetical protein n=1 Tax=Tunturiibacter gelidiferens TaxID=3069689 RepID=UPI003D9AEC7F